MYSVSNPVGRLLTCRFEGSIGLEEAQRAIVEVRAALARATDKVVVCGDIRNMGVLAAEVSDMFIALFKQDNPRLERSALLVGNAIVALQLERMIREGNNPARKTFRDIDAMIAFLDPILTQPERDALHPFVR